MQKMVRKALMKARKLLALALLPTALAACGPEGNEPSSSIEEPPVVTDPDASGTEAPDSSATGVDVKDWDGIIRVYYKYDGDISDKAIYVWGDTSDGVEYAFDGVEEGYGPYKDFDCNEGILKGDVTDKFKFIIKKPGTWDGQSQDTVISLSSIASGGEIKDGRRWLYIWAIDGEGNAIEGYPSKTEALGDNLTSVSLNPDWESIDVAGTASFDRIVIYGYSPEYRALSVPEQYQRRDECVYYDSDEVLGAEGIADSSTTINIKIGKDKFDPQTTYEINAYFDSNTERLRRGYANCYKIYDTPEFIEGYTYDGHDLGVTYEDGKTTFKVWAPTSTEVGVYIYNYGTPRSLLGYKEDEGNEAAHDAWDLYRLKNLGQGVWGVTVEDKDLRGKFYQFALNYNGINNLSIDPYAKASGINGVRGAIIDFDETDPEGWDEVSFEDISSPTELTVYEAHVRDLTADKTWISHDPSVKNGTYRAFVEPGTTYNGVTTGFDHLKELGINAIQLLPIFDQDNDERSYWELKSDNTLEYHTPDYNWGYNPQNYNVPEGSYASDPADPISRIKDLKYLIMELSKVGIRTIMDVVYNHVSTVATHPFQVFAPRYYFRYTDDGYLVNDTGVNNTVNTDRIMASRFVIDSVAWWAKEYKMMGFRFDLMGVLDTGTMRNVKDSLYDIDPDIVVYGEGWTGGSSSSSSPADIGNVYAKLQDNGKGTVGVFNDCVRDGMKGNTTYANVTPQGGNFLDSYTPSEDKLWNSATMYLGENRSRKSGGLSTPPEMSVNYLSCHDNYTLYDQLNYLLHGPMNAGKDHMDAIEATIGSTATLLASEGIAFIHGGEEIFRTKLMHSDDPQFEDFVAAYGEQTNGTDTWIAGDGVEIDEDTWLVRNSYTWGDEVNAYHWDRKAKFYDEYLRYVDAIKMRNDLIDSGYLGRGKTSIDNGDISPFIGNVANAAYIGAQMKSTAGKKLLALQAGRSLGMVNVGLPSGATPGTYKVVYSSAAERTGATVNFQTNLALEPFECLILEYME